jgi:tetratricopeptide (TPR) repeat protein
MIVAVCLLLLFPTCSRGQIQTQTANVDVRVTDVASEQAVYQAKVELLRFPEGVLQMAFTDSSGRAAFYRLAARSYAVRASKAGYQDAEVSFDVRRGESAKTVFVQMRPIEPEKALAQPGTVSSRALSIPKPAAREFQKGLEFLNKRKDPGRSVECFQKAIRLHQGYYEAYFMMGMAHLRLKSNDEAQRALEKAIELNSRFLDPYYPLSVLLIVERRYDEAEQLLLRGMELDPQGWRWPFELTRCYANRGQWDKAMSYAQMVNDRPDSPTTVHLLMADIYSNTGSPGKAIEELEEFIRLDPASSYVPRARQVIEELRKRL